MNLYELAHWVGNIQPGQSITISSSVLREAAPAAPLVGLGGPVWTSAERIMENIVGSAYEFRFSEDPITGNVTFERLAQPLKRGRTYTSPDCR